MKSKRFILTVTSCLVCFFFFTHSVAGYQASVPSQNVGDRPAKSAAKSPANQRGDYDFEKKGGIVYKQGEGFELTCDVYVPELDGPLPTLLVIHGGGWRSGSKLHWIRHARKLAAHGYVVVAINYRHAPRYKFPAQIHDAKQAVRFIKKNAEQYKIDVERIGAYGYSAGGHLACLLGTSDSEDGLEGEIPDELKEFDSRICAVAAGGAPTEFNWLGKRSRALSYWLGDGVTIARNPEVFEKAYPTTYITPDDPAFYFYHGGEDRLVPAKAARVMHEKLQAAGLESHFQDYPDYGHIGLFGDTGAPVDEVIKFFDEQLAAKKKSAVEKKKDEK